MATIEVKCPYCGSNQVIKYGTRTGRQRYAGKNEDCTAKIFQLEYANNGCRPGIDNQIPDMAMNASGIRDTARVLGISIGKVTDVLKKSLETNQNKSGIYGGGGNSIEAALSIQASDNPCVLAMKILSRFDKYTGDIAAVELLKK